MKTPLSHFSFPKSCPDMPQFSRNWAKQEASMVNFSQICSEFKTEAIMTETAGKGGCPPKLLSFMNEMNPLPIRILGF